MKKHILPPLLSIVLLSAATAPGADKTSVPPGPSLRLSEYKLVRGPIALKNVSKNLSGLAFEPTTTNLLAVVNYPPELLQLSLNGEVLARFGVGGGADTESVEVIGPGRFVVADEVSGAALAFRWVTTADGKREVAEVPGFGITIDRGIPCNLGLEGLAWDPSGRRLFGVKEKVPTQLFQATVPDNAETGAEVAVKALWEFKQKDILIDDAAGLHWDAGTGHLLVVSDESRCVVEFTEDGREIGRLALPQMKQPEGVALDHEGTLYVVGEPNELCIFRRAAP